ARTISDTPRVATTTGIRRVVSGASPRGAREGAERRELWGRLCLGAGCAKVPHEGPDAGRGPREEAADDRSHEREPRQIEAGALGSWERQDDARCHDEVVLDEPLPCGGPDLVPPRDHDADRDCDSDEHPDVVIPTVHCWSSLCVKCSPAIT